MNLNNIDGVRELTLKECEEINGGGAYKWISALAKFLWKECKSYFAIRKFFFEH